MIENHQIILPRPAAGDPRPLGVYVEEHLKGRALRWYIAQIDDARVVVEATLLTDGVVEREVGPRPFRPGRCAVLSVIPTGVGCEIGGYAGDAAPITRLLARTADYLITNPNAVNASNFIHLDPNVLYTEGLLIDRFMRGSIDLHVPYANRVGLIIERSTPAHLEVVYNVVNMARAVHGVDIVDCVITDGPVGSRCRLNGSGAYVGTVDHPEQLDRAAAELRARGAQALAVTTNIQDLPHDAYVRHFAGKLPNPMGGVEAIVSHFIVHRHGVPAAHAPMINLKELALPSRIVDARGAGELASESGLACVLIGLARAPQPGPEHNPRIRDVIDRRGLLALVTPAGCLGGVPAIYADRLGVPIVAVRSNSTVLDVTAAKMGHRRVIEVANYAEAAGVLLALREGICLEAITRPLSTLRPRGLM